MLGVLRQFGRRQGITRSGGRAAVTPRPLTTPGAGAAAPSVDKSPGTPTFDGRRLRTLFSALDVPFDERNSAEIMARALRALERRERSTVEGWAGPWADNAD